MNLFSLQIFYNRSASYSKSKLWRSISISDGLKFLDLLFHHNCHVKDIASGALQGCCRQDFEDNKTLNSIGSLNRQNNFAPYAVVVFMSSLLAFEVISQLSNSPCDCIKTFIYFYYNIYRFFSPIFNTQLIKKS